MFVLKKREYSLNMNFVISQSHMFVRETWNHMFVIYANCLVWKFVLWHFVLFENIKLLGQINIFIYCFRIIMSVLCSWYTCARLYTFIWRKGGITDILYPEKVFQFSASPDSKKKTSAWLVHGFHTGTHVNFTYVVFRIQEFCAFFFWVIVEATCR